VEIADSVLDLIGNTPMVRLGRISKGLPTAIVAKVEASNPGGSVKDRPAVAMIDAAEAAGLLKPGGTIIEPTSGNTGVGLAIVAAQRGYKCIFVVTDKVADEKVQLLRAYGAEVVVCQLAVTPEDPASYYSTAERLFKETPGAFRPDQYSNQLNPQSHFDTTGPEIWRQTDGKITHFVSGMGTGGTISGVGRYLKSMNPDIQIVGADPEGSVYSGGSGRPYLVEGIGEDFWPTTYHADVVDRVIAVSDEDSFRMAREIATTEGLLIGGSGGTAICGALRLAEESSADDLIVVLLPDSGRGYLSKVFDDTYMATLGFIQSEGPIVRDIMDERSEQPDQLIYVHPENTVSDAVLAMRTHGFSQLPVAKGEMPIALAEVMGSIHELQLMEKLYEDEDLLDRAVGNVMAPALPTIGIGQPVQLAVGLLDTAPALLVLSGGRPLAVLSRTDVVAFLSRPTRSRR